MVPPLARLFIAAVLINGAYDAVRLAVSYRVLALGGDGVSVGVVTAMFSVLPMLLALYFGRLVDRKGSWGVLAAGTILSMAAVGLATLSTTIAILAIANTALGLGQVLTMIGAQGFIMELTEPGRHVNGFAMFTLAVSVGQSVGTPAMGALLQAGRDGDIVNTNVALFVMGVAIALAIPLVLSLPRSNASLRQSGRPDVATMPALLRRSGMVPAIFAALIVITGIDLITAYLPVIGEAAGLSPMVIALLVALRSVFSMISRATMPWALRRWSQTAILIASPAITAPAVLLVGISQNVYVMGFCLALVGYFWGMNQPVTMNWVITAAPAADRAAALSLRLTGNRAAQVVIPLGTGAVAGFAGAGSVFLVSGALTAASAVSTTLSLRRKPVAELGKVAARAASR
ncbi:MFS transporter [Tomitella biformata]|uniref:MFS transporter n=1 Tax=Tomitella biformata TaxID=630403 RepID=UPI000463DB4B|nr:MFS transporter [Tomitella biformata]